MSDVAKRISPPEGIQPQNPGTAMEQSKRSQTRNKPVPFLSRSKIFLTVIRESDRNKTTTLNGFTKIYSLALTTPHIEESLVRDKQTDGLCIQLTSTPVLKRKQEELYVPLDFKKSQATDALVDSGAYASAIALNELDTKKTTSPEYYLQNR